MASEVTTREAVELLGVSQRRVRALIKDGRLHGRRVGNQWVIDRAGVAAQLALTSAGAVSRPLSSRSAWAVAALADSLGADWVDSSVRSRLRQRLMRGGSVESWLRWLDRRAVEVHRYVVARSDIEELLAHPSVVASGVSAARHLGLELGAGSDAVVYVRSDELAALGRTFLLVPSTDGNLTVRTVDHDRHQQTASHATGGACAARLMVAADLLAAGDARARRAGETLLQRLVGRPVG